MGKKPEVSEDLAQKLNKDKDPSEGVEELSKILKKPEVSQDAESKDEDPSEGAKGLAEIMKTESEETESKDLAYEENKEKVKEDLKIMTNIDTENIKIQTDSETTPAEDKDSTLRTEESIDT